GADLVCQALQTVRQLFAVYRGPVSQGAGVVVPVAKPAVVQDKQLYSQIPALTGQGEKIPLGKAEVKALPAVDQYRPGLVLPDAPDNVAADELVEIFAHGGKAVRPGHH